MASQDLSPATGVKLDTSGHVRRPGFAKPLGWSDLDPFEQGYIEALFASFERDFMGAPRVEITEKPEGVGRLFLNVGFSDLAPEALARIIADCGSVLSEYLDYGRNDRALGDAFWTYRREGTWASKGFPPLTVTLGDDGKVHLSPATPPTHVALEEGDRSRDEP